MATGTIADEHWQSDKTALECHGHMLEKELATDVTLLVSNTQAVKGEEKVKESCKTIRAHKYVLASRSPVFMNMFYGPMAETTDEIVINDVDPDAFKKVLRYIYTDSIELDGKLVMYVWYIAKKYMLNTLSSTCTDFLDNQLSPENAAILLDQSIFFDTCDLIKKCLRKIRRNPSDCLKAPSLVEIRQSTLNRILDMEQINVKEHELFQSCKKWAESRCEEENIEISGPNMRRMLGGSLNKIRFPIIPLELFNSEVAVSNILPPSDEIKLFRYLCPGSTKEKQDVPYSYDARFKPPGHIKLYKEMNDAEKVEMTGNVAYTLELDITENINLQGLCICNFSTLANGPPQDTSDVVVSAELNGRFLGQRLVDMATVSNNKIKQMTCNFGCIQKGRHQLVIHIWRLRCYRCLNPQCSLNKSVLYKCDYCSSNTLRYGGNIVGLKQSFVKLEDEFVDVTITNNNAAFLPICGILYTV